jgi:hypothetical protein
MQAFGEAMQQVGRRQLRTDHARQYGAAQNRVIEAIGEAKLKSLDADPAVMDDVFNSELGEVGEYLNKIESENVRKDAMTFFERTRLREQFTIRTIAAERSHRMALDEFGRKTAMLQGVLGSGGVTLEEANRTVEEYANSLRGSLVGDETIADLIDQGAQRMAISHIEHLIAADPAKVKDALNRDMIKPYIDPTARASMLKRANANLELNQTRAATEEWRSITDDGWQEWLKNQWMTVGVAEFIDEVDETIAAIANSGAEVSDQFGAGVSPNRADLRAAYWIPIIERLPYLDPKMNGLERFQLLVAKGQFKHPAILESIDKASAAFDTQMTHVQKVNTAIAELRRAATIGPRQNQTLPDAPAGLNGWYEEHRLLQGTIVTAAEGVGRSGMELPPQFVNDWSAMVADPQRRDMGRAMETLLALYQFSPIRARELAEGLGDARGELMWHAASNSMRRLGGAAPEQRSQQAIERADVLQRATDGELAAMRAMLNGTPDGKVEPLDRREVMPKIQLPLRTSATDMAKGRGTRMDLTENQAREWDALFTIHALTKAKGEGIDLRGMDLADTENATIDAIRDYAGLMATREVLIDTAIPIESAIEVPVWGTFGVVDTQKPRVEFMPIEALTGSSSIAASAITRTQRQAINQAIAAHATARVIANVYGGIVEAKPGRAFHYGGNAYVPMTYDGEIQHFLEVRLSGPGVKTKVIDYQTNRELYRTLFYQGDLTQRMDDFRIGSWANRQPNMAAYYAARQDQFERDTRRGELFADLADRRFYAMFERMPDVENDVDMREVGRLMNAVAREYGWSGYMPPDNPQDNTSP